MSVIRYEFVKLELGSDRPKAVDYLITDVVAAGDVTASVTETPAGSQITVPNGAGYVILTGVSGGNTLVGFGKTPDAANKGKQVREGQDVILVVSQGEKLSFKTRT